jgi:hypothetical protein
MRIFIHPGAGLLALAAGIPLAVPAAAQAAPDLVPVINSVSPNPSMPNANVTVRTTIRNQGSSAANLDQRRPNGTVIHMVRWYFKERGTGPDRFIMAMSMLGTLGPGQTKVLSPSPKIPADAKAGNHTICAVVDPENRVRETNEGNNRTCFRIRVGGRGMPKPGAPGRGGGTDGRDILPGSAGKPPVRTPKICPGLPAPRHVAPRNGSTFNTFPRTTRFRWSPVGDAKSYGIEVDCMHCCVQGKWCSDVGQTWHVKDGLTSPAYVHNFVGAQPGRWRVWAVDACGKKGKVSGWWKFEYTR